MFFRQTWLKRLFTEILGLNHLDIKEVSVNGTIVPTVEIKPSQNIVRSLIDQDSQNTIYQAPLDKDFYLTSASISARGDLAMTTAYISITDEEGETRVILTLAKSNTINATSISQYFGERGIKVKRGGIVSLYYGGDGVASGVIVGYTAGDR